MNPKRITALATLFDAFQMVKTIRPILGPQRNPIETAPAPASEPAERADVELAGVAAYSGDLSE